MNYAKQLRTLFALLLMIAAIFACDSPATDAAGELLPKPAQREYVVDTAGIVSAEDRAQIEKIGEELREKTKAEIVVVTVHTLDGADIESYANKLFRSWGIGDANQSNGVLLLIAKDDRKFRIEVGYGLEGEITDGRSGEILDKMKPYFRDEKYSEGVLNAYQKLAAYAYRAAGVAPGADVSETLEDASTHEEEPSILVNVLIFFLAIVGMIVLGVILNWLLGVINNALGPDSGGSSRRDRDFSNDSRSSSRSSSSGPSRGGYGGGSSGGGGASGGW
ncbi:TPM domain-containing protein [Selenomonas sputigena]|uniref:TPM domain-containing protein n=1 Tax=Selenomonas sputigena TaxID=69823 RepID=UPI002234ADDC|nr:TPM domain-containing protein [Selenomonas sputigena]UZE44634.1 TPM domain-containing protein [Selenomonas sputigena]